MNIKTLGQVFTPQSIVQSMMNLIKNQGRFLEPIFIHPCKAYDGSILAIFPKFETNQEELEIICEQLNSLNWEELGFVCDGRFLFSQRSLEGCFLEESFILWLKRIKAH